MLGVIGALTLISSTALAEDWKLLDKSPARCMRINAVTDLDLVCVTNDAVSSTKLTIVHSSDGGKTWAAPLKGPEDFPFGTSFTGFFRDANLGFIGRDLANKNEQLVQKTADGGKTWAAKNLTTAGHQSIQIRAVHFKAKVGYVVGIWSDGGSPAPFVARSEDEGETWKEQTLSGGNTANNVAVIDDNTAVIVAEQGIWRTTNAGGEWTNVNAKSNIGASFLKFVDATHGYAGGFFKTSDGGATWQDATLPKNPTNQDLRGLDFADPMNGIVAFSGDSKSSFFRTKDGAATWTPETAPADFHYNASWVAYPSTHVAYVSGALGDPQNRASVVSAGEGAAGPGPGGGEDAGTSGGADAGSGPGTGTGDGTGTGTGTGTSSSSSSGAAGGGGGDDDGGCNMHGSTPRFGAAFLGLALAVLLRRRRANESRA